MGRDRSVDSDECETLVRDPEKQRFGDRFFFDQPPIKCCVNPDLHIRKLAFLARFVTTKIGACFGKFDNRDVKYLFLIE